MVTFLQTEDFTCSMILELAFLNRFFHPVLGAQKTQFLLESHSWLFSSAALIYLECWGNLWVLSQSPRSASCSYSEVQFAQNLLDDAVVWYLTASSCCSLLSAQMMDSLSVWEEKCFKEPFCFLQQRLHTLKICKMCAVDLYRDVGSQLINYNFVKIPFALWRAWPKGQ